MKGGFALKTIHKKYTGPFIGILTSDGGSSFRGNHYNFADIIRTAKKMGIAAFVVTPTSFQSEGAIIKGYVLSSNSKKIQWEKANLPIPDVIYNRIPSRKSEQSKSVQAAFSIIHTKNIPIFNPTFFNKLHLYNQLSASPRLKHLVPQSASLNSPTSLQKILLRYPTVYLKPIDGKAGIGMMRIIHRSDKFELIHQSADKRQNFILSTFSDLWKKITLLSKQTPYVIQQGIHLAHYQGNPFDLRMLVQKNSEGVWKVTGIGIRVAGNTAISTHVPQGGRIELADQVLEEAFTDSKEEIITYAKEIGLQVAQYIEHQQTGFIGEMSMDWGLDTNGDLWFFEANSKPMKFDEPHIRSLSLKRIIQYSVYLSKNREVMHYGTP